MNICPSILCPPVVHGEIASPHAEATAAWSVGVDLVSV